MLFRSEAARHIDCATTRALARMRDTWSDDYVVTTLPSGGLPTLEALALHADIYDQGLDVFGR